MSKVKESEVWKMAFCDNCGKELIEGAKFCFECGTKVNNRSENSGQRKVTYSGELHKCPQCGEVLQSFVSLCPVCGYELRGSKATDSVREFAARFAKAATLEKKIDLITTYAIPNTSEDVREFLILTLSNIGTAPAMTEQEIQLTNAWVAKYEQAYQKAKMLSTHIQGLEDINAEFLNKNKRFQAAQRKRSIGNFSRNNKKVLGIIAIIIAGIIGTVVVFWPLYGQPWAKEQKLEKLVKQVEQHIEAEEYDQARMKAKQIIDDSGYSYTRTQKWNDIREALLEEIEEKQRSAEGKKQVGKSSDELLEMNYQDVINYLSGQGFTNIEAKPIKKGVLGWFTDEGKVETVTIGGNDEFEEDVWYDVASKIIVTYYARKE